MILNKKNPETLETISTIIRDGGVAILPCDTIYGLCAAYGIGEKPLIEIKGRDKNKAFLVLATLEQAKELCSEIPEDILAAWPAALTVILNKKEGGTIAIRVPNDEFLQSVLKAVGCPIYSTSVNISGEQSLTNLSAICRRFEALVDVVVRGDEIQGRVPSTLIDATVRPYKLVRQGLYDANALIKGLH
ncbi:MAG: L-threonylcarbamoyladenylate synthase [Spirochaetales bacterium]|nr:L-threonylcarbamoyladenylate synthase [Spirochaetales bacterium]